MVDSLWDELISCLKRCYKGPFDSEFLAQMSELLKVIARKKTTCANTKRLDFAINIDILKIALLNFGTLLLAKLQVLTILQI